MKNSINRIMCKCSVPVISLQHHPQAWYIWWILIWCNVFYFLTEKFTVNLPVSKPCNFQCPPKFIVPLRMHIAPQGYECYMSCAITGDPQPHVTWLRNNISLNTNSNYYISNTCGVCSLLILRVRPKDIGEYKVVAENSIGMAECSTTLTVRGKSWTECTCI